MKKLRLAALLSGGGTTLENIFGHIAAGQLDAEVAAVGSPPLSYQWQRNGGDLPGATQRTYTIDPVTWGDDGAVFQCVVTKPEGSTTSDGATLSVVDWPPSWV